MTRRRPGGTVLAGCQQHVLVLEAGIDLTVGHQRPVAIGRAHTDEMAYFVVLDCRVELRAGLSEHVEQEWADVEVILGTVRPIERDIYCL